MSKYGSENSSFEYRELQATTMSVDRNGFYALLAGRKYLSIVNLENNKGEMVVRIPYGGKYEISNTQWAHLSTPIFGVANSQRCDIFELTDGADLKTMYQLKAHTRVITDLDWSTLSPNLLATSSFDTYLYVWDLRCPRDPASERAQVSLTALDGASQVTWNKWKTDCLASCDGGHVKIWDIRKPTSPSEYIAAHASKINGLEWVSKDTLITAAQDCTARFSRLAASNPGKIKGPCLTATTPIWRARPTPFGKAIVTQCVPILRRDSGLLSLWNFQSFTNPIYTFQGHDIIEFAWKKSSLCDLVTWSRDHTLRLWSLPREIIELCGEDALANTNQTLPTLSGVVPPHEIEESVINANSISTSLLSNGKPSLEKYNSLDKKSKKPFSNIPIRDELLNEEFDSVAGNMSDNINFELVDIERGLLRFGWKSDAKSLSVSIGVLMSFPVHYPSAVPTFFVTGAGGNEIDKNKLLKTLTQVAQNCLNDNEPCVSPCILAFSEFMKQVKPLEEPTNPYLFPSRGASNVPFPRTSGARFCSVGVLVCFGRPTYLKRVKSNCDAGTPRSLSALGPYLNQLTEESSMSTPHKSRRRRVEKKRAGLVTIFDVTSLLPLTRELAMNYKHVSTSRTRKTTCAENAQIAKNHKKLGVSHTWTCCSVISDFTCSYNHSGPKLSQRDRTADVVIDINVNEDMDDEDLNWIAYHPLGSELIHNIITHYSKYGDLQTSAAVACQYTISVSDHASGVCHHGFQQPQLSRVNSSNDLNNSQNQTRSSHSQSQPWNISLGGPPQPRPGMGSPYHTVHGTDTIHGVTNNPISDSFFRQHRSNSWSDSLDDGKIVNNGRGHEGASGGSDGNGYLTRDNWTVGKAPFRGVILDPNMSRVYDGYKKSYAEILYRWGLLQERAEVLKCLTDGLDNSFLLRAGVDYLINCRTCNQGIRGPHCSTCKRVSSICSICHMPAKGLCTFCAACGHGGHAPHMSQWFKGTRQTCPTGCGCECVNENSRMYK